MSSLTPNSKIIRAIDHHIETGIPIDSHGLSPEEKLRVQAVFHLFKSWQKNPLLDKRMFLMHVHHRASHEIANDLYCFEHIKSIIQDTMSISRADAEYIHDMYTKKLLQAGDANGDAALWDKGLKHLEKSKKIGQDAPPEDVAKKTATLPYVFTRDIRVIDPERETISDEHKNKILAKYGGTPDATAENIRKKKLSILGLEEDGNASDMPSIIDMDYTDDDE